MYPFDRYTCKITLNYLQFYLQEILAFDQKKDDSIDAVDKFKGFVTNMKKYGGFWLGNGHSFVC